MAKVAVIKTTEELIAEADNLGIATVGATVEEIARELVEVYVKRLVVAKEKRKASWQARIDAVLALVPSIATKKEEQMELELMFEEVVVAEAVEAVEAAEEAVVAEAEVVVEEEVTEEEIDDFLYGEIDEEEFFIGAPEEFVAETVAEVVVEEKVVETITEPSTDTVKQPKKALKEEKEKNMGNSIKKLSVSELKTILKDRKIKGYSKLKKAELVALVEATTPQAEVVVEAVVEQAEVVAEEVDAQAEVVEAEPTVEVATQAVVVAEVPVTEENPIRTKLKALGMMFTDTCYNKLNIADLTAIYNIVNGAVVDTTVEDSIPLEVIAEAPKTVVKEAKVEAPVVTAEVPVIPAEQPVVEKVKVEVPVVEEPKVQQQKPTRKPMSKVAPKVAPKVEQAQVEAPKAEAAQTTAEIAQAATPENNTVKVLKRVINMASRNRVINFISDHMLTSAINEVLHGRSTKDYVHNVFNSFSKEEVAQTEAFKAGFVNRFLIANDKGTGYTIKAVAMASFYKEVVYRYRREDGSGKVVIADYYVDYTAGQLKMRGSENVHELNAQTFDTLDRTCVFLSVCGQAAPKGAANAPKKSNTGKGNNSNNASKKPSYDDRMAALVNSLQTKFEAAMKSDVAAEKEAVAEEIKKAIAQTRDRVVARKLTPFIEKLTGVKVVVL